MTRWHLLRVWMLFHLLGVTISGETFARDLPKKYALLVGVNKYEHAAMNGDGLLKYAEADVVELAKLLEQSGYEVELLEGAKATKRAIDAKLASIEEKGNSDGVVLVALAGHGVQFEADEEAYFCPYDVKIREAVRDGRNVLDRNGRPLLEPNPASCIKLTDIVDQFRLAPAGTRILMADCCRNDLTTGRGRGVGSGIKADRLPSNTAVLLSCSHGQRSWEDDRWKHGAFFYHVLKGLEEGKGTVAQLDAYLETAVPQDVKATVREAPDQVPHVLRNAGKLDFGLARLSLPGTSAGEAREFGDLKIAMRWCPPGKFKMGSPDSDEDAGTNEKPQVNVTLSRGFWLGQTEVTQGQWEALMRTTPWKGRDFVMEGANYPAVFVSHGLDADGNVEKDSATEFCRKLTERERVAGRLSRGWEYRLPTEAEWEYACRAGKTTKYSFGDDATQLGAHAWYVKNAWDIGEMYAHKVGQKRANPWGLYDMSGNVWELCADWYSDVLPGGHDPTGPTSGSYWVYRGGCSSSSARILRSAYRSRGSQSLSGSSMGFRVALTSSGD